MIQHKIIHLTTLSSYSMQWTRMRGQILTYFEPWQRLWGRAGGERTASWWGREMLAGQRSQVNWVTETVHSSHSSLSRSSHQGLMLRFWPTTNPCLGPHHDVQVKSFLASCWSGWLMSGFLLDPQELSTASIPSTSSEKVSWLYKSKELWKDKFKLLVWKWIM